MHPGIGAVNDGFKATDSLARGTATGRERQAINANTGRSRDSLSEA